MAVTVESLTLWLADIARPLQAWLEPESVQQFLSELGLPATDVVAEHPEVVRATADIVTAVSELTPLVPELADAIQDGDAIEISTVLERAAPLVAGFVAVLHDLRTAIDTAAYDAGDSGPAVRRFAAELVERLLGYLLSVHLAIMAPMVHDLTQLIGLIELLEVLEDGTGPTHLRRLARFDRLAPLLADPVAAIGETYGWNTDDFDWDLFSRRLFYILMTTGFVSVEEDPAGGPKKLRIALVDIGPTRDKPGIRATTRATIGADTTAVGQLSERVSWQAGSEGALEHGTALELVPPATLRVIPPSADLRGKMSIGIMVEDPDGEHMVLLGSAGGSRIEATSVRLSAATDLDWEPDVGEAAGDLALSVAIAGGRFVLDLSDADSFLRSWFPADGLAIDVDVGVSWSAARGLHIEGGAGLERQFPIDRLLGPVRANAFAAGLEISEGALTVKALVNATARLGPIALGIDRVGAEISLSSPGGGGNFGLVDLIARFSPPDGLGLSIDAGPVNGGGYLSFDPGNERYAGAAQLDVGGIALNAIGLLTTRLPNDTTGYSLLVLVSSAYFTPVNLGFGFTLNGVGGLLGLDRTADIDELRTGLRSGGLDGLLFPDDPVGEADELIGRFRQIFPPTPGRHLVAPAALIGWGTPTVLTIELLLALELPEPVRLVALAQLRARLPSEGQALVQLEMDALGVVDIDRGQASLDAVLHNSHIAGYAVAGEVALRARWLTDPGVVLAAGGMNPRYPHPADFPQLERLSIRLERDRTRLHLEAYLALTSNTVQLGARLCAEVTVGGFTIDGALQFDALFELSPFGFAADFAGAVRARWGSRSLLSVRLEMSVSGPAPMYARGSAKLEAWRFSHAISFDATFDGGQPLPPASPADPLPELLEALVQPGNWSAALPREDPSVVSLRGAERPDIALVHPLGELTVRQRIIPLGVQITRYGGMELAGGPRSHDIAVTLPGEIPVDSVTVSDYFAPAQYFDLDDHTKLSAPAFERLTAGVRLTLPDTVFGGQADAGLMTSAPVGHHTSVVDGDGSTRGAATTTATRAATRSLTRRPVARGDLHGGPGGYRGTDLSTRAREPVYVLAKIADLRVESFADAGGSAGLSHTVATQLLREQERHGRSGLQVVVRHESIGALPGLLPPGASPEEPGVYEERGSFGSRVPGARRVRMTPGASPLPPTRAPGRRWQWVAPLAATQ